MRCCWGDNGNPTPLKPNEGSPFDPRDILSSKEVFRCIGIVPMQPWTSWGLRWGIGIGKHMRAQPKGFDVKMCIKIYQHAILKIFKTYEYMEFGSD